MNQTMLYPNIAKNLLRELEPFAKSDVAVLSAEITNEGDILVGRILVREFLKPSSPLEEQILLPRALIRGSYGWGIRKGKPLERAMAVSGPDRPMPDEALQSLDQLQKRFGPHPLIDYYRAVAYAMKWTLADTDDPKRAEFDSKAIEYARSFLKAASAYPRLKSTAESYVVNSPRNTATKIMWFFPPKDE